MLYRVMGELLTNIIKHARTQEAEIEIHTTQAGLHLRIQDQGDGMDVRKSHEN